MNRLLSAVALCTLSATQIFASEDREQIKKEAYERLEKGLEQAGLGLVETGVGVYRATKGDPVGAATGIGAGAKSFKDSVESFRDAKELFARSREDEDD